MSMNVMLIIGGIGFGIAGCIWLWIAWSWYTSFPLPYIWLVWAVSSVLWFAASWILLSGPLLQRARMRHLKQVGVRIKTKFFNVETNFRVRMNYQYPYYVQSVGADPKSGEKLMFRSEDIWFDPTSLIDKGQDIDVIIDPQNPSEYVMDLSFLANKVNELGRSA